MIGLLLLLQGPPACPANVACINWTAVTQNTDNTAVSGPIRYRVHRQNGAQWIQLTEVSQVGVTLTGLPLGEQCFAVTAVDALDRESDRSNVSCKTLKVPAPTDGSIEAPTDGSIEYPK